jgi:hypothetical protein
LGQGSSQYPKGWPQDRQRSFGLAGSLELEVCSRLHLAYKILFAQTVLKELLMSMYFGKPSQFKTQTFLHRQIKEKDTKKNYKQGAEANV